MSDLNNREKFLNTIATGRVCMGSVVSLADPAISELIAEAGYDFTWIDLEHTSLNVQSAAGHVMAVRGTKTAPFVRVPWNDPILLKPVLELSPAGVIIPMIRTPAEAARAVAACKYPPAGERGFGPCRGMRYGGVSTSEYLATADSETLVILQIEHVDALSSLERIIETPGVDGICAGPYDLSGSMGKLGQVDDPAVRDAVVRIIRTTRRLGKLSGLAADFNPLSFRLWIDAGAQWINIGTDWDQLFTQSRSVLNAARGLETRGPAS
jgi:2-keto-3-deoxy-L-rhamnonate aldolase RhmA